MPNDAVPVESVGPGRPAIPIDYQLLGQLARKGMTQDEIAALLKISATTFRSRMKDDEVFAETYTNNRAHAQLSLRQLGWKHASGKGPAAVSMTIHMLKHLCGETDKSVVEHGNKDGKALQISIGHPTDFMGVNLADASDEELEAMAVIAAGRERRAAEAARDITGQVQEEP